MMLQGPWSTELGCLTQGQKGSNTFLKYDSFRHPYLFGYVLLDSRKGLTQLCVMGPIAMVCLRTSNSWNVEPLVIKPGMSQVSWDKLFTILGLTVSPKKTCLSPSPWHLFM